MYMDPANPPAKIGRPSLTRPRRKSYCQFVEDYDTGSIVCTSPTSARKYYILEDISDSAKEYCVPFDRFWTQDQVDLRSEAFARNMMVLVETDPGSQEFVGGDEHGRNRTDKVVKAVLCYPDSGKPKNGYVDVCG
jgi:hypothetical protein